MSENTDKAMELFKNKQYKECIDVFHSILETSPDNANIYNNMAVMRCIIHLACIINPFRILIKKLNFNF